MSGLSVFQVGYRMLSAAAIGFSTNVSMNAKALSWGLSNGPWYISGLFVAVFAVCLFLGLRSRFVELSRGLIQPQPQRAWLVASLAIGSGIVIIALSYLIFLADRYPPNIKVGRLANIHSGSRWGIFLCVAGVLLIISLLDERLREQGKLFWHRRLTAWTSVCVAFFAASFVAFNHAYGYQQVQASRKKHALEDALQYACERTSSDDVIVLVIDDKFRMVKTDVVISWAIPYLGATAFKQWDNKFLIVERHKLSGFLNAISRSESVQPADLVPFVDGVYSIYPWLYPWGAVQRWDLRHREFFVLGVELRDQMMTPTILKEPAQPRPRRTCEARPG